MVALGLLALSLAAFAPVLHGEFLLSVLVAGLFSLPALAFESFVVKDIRVEGIQRIEAGTVFTYLPVRVGETLTDDKAAAAIRSLYATGFFKDVRIEVENNVVVVVLEERLNKDDLPDEYKRRLRSHIKEWIVPRFAEFLEKELQMSYLDAYGEYGQNLFDRYVTYADKWLLDEDWRDPDTGMQYSRDALNTELEKIESQIFERGSGRNNIERAGLSEWVRIYQGELATFEPRPDQNQKGLVICNPPWGERLELPDARLFYGELGDWWRSLRDFRAAFLEHIEQVIARRFAVVVHVGFVGEAEDQDATALEGAAAVVERLGDAMHDVFGHGGVDLAGQLDEARVFTVLARLPGQIERVDRNAVAAQPGPGHVQRGGGVAGAVGRDAGDGQGQGTIRIVRRYGNRISFGG